MFQSSSTNWSNNWACKEGILKTSSQELHLVELFLCYLQIIRTTENVAKINNMVILVLFRWKLFKKLKVNGTSSACATPMYLLQNRRNTESEKYLRNSKSVYFRWYVLRNQEICLGENQRWASSEWDQFHLCHSHLLRRQVTVEPNLGKLTIHSFFLLSNYQTLCCTLFCWPVLFSEWG